MRNHPQPDFAKPDSVTKATDRPYTRRNLAIVWTRGMSVSFALMLQFVCLVVFAGWSISGLYPHSGFCKFGKAASNSQTRFGLSNPYSRRERIQSRSPRGSSNPHASKSASSLMRVQVEQDSMPVSSSSSSSVLCKCQTNTIMVPACCGTMVGKCSPDHEPHKQTTDLPGELLD